MVPRNYRKTDWLTHTHTYHIPICITSLTKSLSLAFTVFIHTHIHTLSLSLSLASPHSSLFLALSTLRENWLNMIILLLFHGYLGNLQAFFYIYIYLCAYLQSYMLHLKIRKHTEGQCKAGAYRGAARKGRPTPGTDHIAAHSGKPSGVLSLHHLIIEWLKCQRMSVCF